MASTLPSFSGGLKLARLGVITMLLQIAGSIALIVMAFTADTAADSERVYEYVKYLMLANVVAVGLMLVGVVRALPELARAKVNITTLAISTLGFAVAAAALLWSYFVITDFYDTVKSVVSAIDDAPTFEAMQEQTNRIDAAKSRLESLPNIAVVKDLAYGAGLYFLIRTVQVFAAANDQLALRDLAASMSRALMVMVVGDLFYQLTYGKGGVGITGLIAFFLVHGYWIWCHVKLVRFLENSAWFANEPHNLPTAKVVLRSETETPAARPSQAAMGRASQPAMPRASTAPAERPSVPAVPQAGAAEAPAPRPSQPAPIIVVQQPTAPTPRAQSASDGGPEIDGPRFLR